jgi:hypothetical protein
MIKPSSGDSGDKSPDGSADPPKKHNRSEPNTSDVSDAIKRRLKDLFDKVATEPVPDKHRKLLEELEQKSGKEKPGEAR